MRVSSMQALPPQTPGVFVTWAYTVSAAVAIARLHLLYSTNLAWPRKREDPLQETGLAQEVAVSPPHGSAPSSQPSSRRSRSSGGPAAQACHAGALRCCGEFYRDARG